MRTTQQSLQKGDIIGVCLDLSIPQISFTVNGIIVKGFFRDFNVDGMFFPVISLSAKTRYVRGPTSSRIYSNRCMQNCSVLVSVAWRASISIAPSTRYNLLSNLLSNRFDNRVNVRIHDTTGCQTSCTTGLTTGCIV